MTSLTDKLNMLMDNDMLDDLLELNIDKTVDKILYSYQSMHLHNLVCCYNYTDVVLDGSDTGTGKTYSSIGLCKQMNLIPFIICPSIIMSQWSDVCDLFGVKPLSIVNYETLINCKEYKDGKRVTSKHIAYNEKKKEYTWKNLPKNIIFIFDEVHKCKNKSSYNAKILLSTKKVGKVLMLSATVTDTIQSFHIFAYMMGLCTKIKSANSWIKSLIKEDIDEEKNEDYKKALIKSNIYKHIYPKHGARMRISELGDNFPKYQIESQFFDIDKDQVKKLNKCIKSIKSYEKKMESGEFDNSLCLRKINKADSIIESFKIPIFVELAKNYLESGMSVVIFVNYIDTMKQLMKELNTKIVIHGQLSANVKSKFISKFQKGEERVIILVRNSGSTSISLHDTVGDRPRASIISPSYSAISLQQIVGRTVRNGSKSSSLHRIIFINNSYEDHKKEIIDEKINLLRKVMDG